MPEPTIRKLARQLVSMDTRLKHLETVPQLSNSSIDNVGVPVYDADGNLVAQVGKQADGTWGAPPLNGPVPPAPAGVSFEGGPGVVNVTWSGDYVDGAAPLDFDTLEVLVAGTRAGALSNRSGGSLVVSAPEGSQVVSARVRTLVPRYSVETAGVVVQVGPPPDALFEEAKESIAAAEGDIQAAKDAIAAEIAAREAALADALDQLAQLDGKLGGLPDSAELEEVRQQVAAAQAAVEAAQADASAAQQAVQAAAEQAADAQAAADTANANALAAAGIAADKGRIFYQADAPTGDDRSPNNLWIDSDNGRVHVWNGTAWEESQSEDLRDAAQAAVAAQQAAQAADQKAQDAAAAAAAADAKAQAAQGTADAAQQAAADAQQTADDAVLDAREAHNAAVAAQERAAEIRADLAAGPSVWEDPSFERGGGILESITANAQISRTDEWAASGAHSIKYVSSGTGGNVFGTYVRIPAPPDRWYCLTATVHAGGDDQRWNTTWDCRVADTNNGADLLQYILSGTDGYVTVPAGQTVTKTWFFKSVPGTRFMRFWTGLHSSYNQAANAGQVVYLDDFRLVDVTESYPQFLAAQQAADAAAQAAEEARQLAAGKPDMDDVQQAITVSANGKNAITVSTAAPTSGTPGAVVGDTWWQVDGAGDIFGQWSWTGSKWAARTIKSEVIANLDVGKLTVTGTSRFTEAVVDRLFADIFTAHKITANEITIAALDKDGNLEPGSVRGVHIGDGQVSANKITIVGNPDDPDEAGLVANIASIMELAVENLVVTEGAEINEGVILKLASEMITAGVLRTAEAGQRVVINTSGIVMYGLDEDDQEFELVRIGPSGENLITAGDTTISPAGVQAPSGEFDEIAVGGEDLHEILWPLPRGVVARGWNEVGGRSIGPEGETELGEITVPVENDRAYSLKVEPMSVYLPTGGRLAFQIYIEKGFKGNSAPAPTRSSRLYRSTVWRDSGGDRPMVVVQGNWLAWEDEDATEWRLLFTLRAYDSNSAGAVYSNSRPYSAALAVSVEDVGPFAKDIMTNRTGTTAAPKPPPPAPKRYKKTYSSTSFHTYNANDTNAGTPDVVQGLYAGGPSRLRRRGGWKFPSFTNDLSGATVEKVEMYIYMNHSYYTAGSTVNVATHSGNISNSLKSFRQITGWKRNTGRWITLPSSLYNGFKNGSYKGVGVISTNSYAEQYARFNGSGAKIRITYVK